MLVTKDAGQRERGALCYPHKDRTAAWAAERVSSMSNDFGESVEIVMREALKAQLTDEERGLAQTLGHEADTTMSAKITTLFRQLGDPLFSAADVADLLDAAGEEVETALKTLVEDGTLEASPETQRPLDPEGTMVYRLASVPFQRLKVVAAQSQRSDGTSVLQFACEGRVIRSLARVSRLDVIRGEGNQRDEITKHVERIAQGIREGTQVPNPILLVLRDQNTQEVSEDDSADADSDIQSYIRLRPLGAWADLTDPFGGPPETIQSVRLVELDFPYRPAAFDEEKSALLVDGQQRTAALSLVPVDEHPSLVLSVNALIADDEEAKRIFQVANDTVKIAADFSRALLSTMSDAPAYLRAEQAQAIATRILAIEDADSPFNGLVKHKGTSATSQPVAYNSLFQVIQRFAQSGVLAIGADANALVKYVKRAFEIVKEIWADAWGLKPQESRLMHAVGLRSLAGLIVSKLESKIEIGAELDDDQTWKDLRASLERLRTRIVWTGAAATSAPKAVQKIYIEKIGNAQNTSQDIAELTEFLRTQSVTLDADARRQAKKAAKP